MTIQQVSSPTTSLAKTTHVVADVHVKTELAAEVSHLSLVTPPADLRRSPRKRTAVNFKEESDEDETSVTSRFWPGSSGGPRKRSRTTTKEEEEEVLPTISAPKERGRGRKKATVDGDTPAAKKLKREYAPPEAYAHLDYLNDYLKDHLDGTLKYTSPHRYFDTGFYVVMFCGIKYVVVLE